MAPGHENVINHVFLYTTLVCYQHSSEWKGENFRLKKWNFQGYLSVLLEIMIIFLILKGLRTLELCVDNLQPDFLYDHIQPVRAELMQALWRTLRNPSDSIAQVAFRVLGKFGGGNRKMLREPQKVKSLNQQWYIPGPSICSVTLKLNADSWWWAHNKIIYKQTEFLNQILSFRPWADQSF